MFKILVKNRSRYFKPVIGSTHSKLDVFCKIAIDTEDQMEHRI